MAIVQFQEQLHYLLWPVCVPEPGHAHKLGSSYGNEVRASNDAIVRRLYTEYIRDRLLFGILEPLLKRCLMEESRMDHSWFLAEPRAQLNYRPYICLMHKFMMCRVCWQLPELKGAPLLPKASSSLLLFCLVCVYFRLFGGDHRRLCFSTTCLLTLF